MKKYQTPQALPLSHIHNHNTIFYCDCNPTPKIQGKTVIYITWYRERNESELIVAMSRKHVPNMYTHTHRGRKIARCDRVSPVCHKFGVRAGVAHFTSAVDL